MSKDLTLYEMRETDAQNLERTDPRRLQHRAALQDGIDNLERLHATAVSHGAPTSEAPITTFSQMI